MKKILVLIFALAVVFAPVVAHGAQFVSAKSGEYYLAPSQTVSDNLYIGGKDVTVAGDAQEDLSVAGVNVYITGKIGQDLAGAGAKITIDGNIIDDARVAGGSVSMNGNIGGDLLAIGGTVDLLSGLKVGKSAMLIGGAVDAGGTVNGSVTIYAKKAYIDGTINGDLNFKGAQITLGPEAMIKGNFNYSSNQEAIISDGAQVLGQKNFTMIETPKAGPGIAMTFMGFMTAGWLLKLFILLVAALIMYYVFKDGTKELIKHSVNNFWRELLRGFVLFFIIPIAIIIALITVVGIIPALVVALVYILMLVVGSVFAGILIAGLLSKWLFGRNDYSLDWYVIILGVIVYQLLMLIPFVGWLASGVVFLASLGALYGSLYVKFEPRKK